MPSHTLRAYDRVVPGGIESFLREARAEGQSLRRITARLDEEHGIPVAVETVRGWCRELSIPTERAGAAT